MGFWERRIFLPQKESHQDILVRDFENLKSISTRSTVLVRKKKTPDPLECFPLPLFTNVYAIILFKILPDQFDNVCIG